jgi:hypothetical protein
MTQVVKSYKVLLDDKTTNADKNVLVDLGDIFQFHDYRDLVHLRSEMYMDKFFEKENPTIDFEKYKFKPTSTLDGVDFYFYRKDIPTSTPVSYDDSNPPVWAIDDPFYTMSSGFSTSDVPNNLLYLDSYFKLDFYLDPVSQKTLFSVALPLNGTMLQPGITPAPSVNFNGTIKTEIENIYWLRKPQQLPSVNFSGGTFDLYCLVTFFNSLTGRVINFKRDNNLPNSLSVLNNYTVLDKYVIYRLDYNNLTYNILQIDGTPFLSNRIKLYSL